MKTLPQNLFIFLFLSFILHACNLNFKRGNGVMKKEETVLYGFNKISIGGNYEVTLIQSEEAKVVIETDENLLRYINVEQYEQTLNINSVHNLKSTNGINVKVYYKKLQKIYSTGASQINNEGILIADELMLNLSGAGAITLEIDVENVKVNLTGAGVVTLSGNAEFQETHISGAGGLDAKKLQTNNCNINLSGLGGAQVYVVEKLEATITGIGGIIYGGNPKIIERQVTGFGKIKRADEYFELEDI